MYPVEQEILVVDGDETARALIEHTSPIRALP
jgi:hypothetical protein